MSFRPGLLQNVLRASRPTPITFSQSIHTGRSKIVSLARPFPSPAPGLRFSPFLFPLALGATLLTYNNLSSPARCDTTTTLASLSNRPTPEVGGGNPPHSSLSGYQLGFGAVCGICAGVFVKKGLKALAFLLGGVFVLMQYFSSKKFISVDWGKVAGSYDSAFGTKTPTGEVRAPTVGGVWAWFVDFVTANFQQRATFLAGFALGIRLG